MTKRLIQVALCFMVASLYSSVSPVQAEAGKIYAAFTNGSSIAVTDSATLDAWGAIKTGNRPMMLTATKDGRYVFASIFEESKVQVIDTSTDKVVKDIKVGKKPYAMDISPDGDLLAVGLMDEPGVYLVDTKEFKAIKMITTLGNVSEVKFSPDGKKLFVVHRDKPIQVIDTVKMEAVAEVDIPTETYNIAFSKTGDNLYVNSLDDGNISVIETKTSKVLKKIPAGAQGLAISPDGQELWFGGPEDKITVYSLAKDEVIAVLTRDSDANLVLQFSPDGKTVLADPAGSDNNKVYLFDAVKKEKKGEIVLNNIPRGLAYITK